MQMAQDSAPQRLLLLLLFELELDELLLLLLEARRAGWLGAMPMARAALFTPFSQPRKKPCTAESARAPLRLLFELLLFDELELLLLDELLDEMLDEFEEELEEELEDELLEEFEDEFDEELLDEFELRPMLPLPREPADEAPLPRDPPELPLELLFELLLPAVTCSGFTLSSTSCARAAKSLAEPRPCACAAPLPTRPATAVTITPSCCFMGILFAGWLGTFRRTPLGRAPEPDPTTRQTCRAFPWAR
ncbi:hypothetical protein [Hydrogenophaga sp.]|uniref:hypothetical protein n=1 Tax=Hydrogenophaga sp. TaxID=1904254 RepID=UPI003F7104DD